MTAAGRAAAMAAAALLAAAGAATLARPHAKDRPLDPADVPAWVRDAAARTLAKTAADSATLDDELIVEPLAEGGVRETSRTVTRVLTPDGLDDAADCETTYRSTDTVKSVAAWTILPDGSAWKADPKRDGHDDPTKFEGLIVEGSRLRWIAAPRVAVGAAVACEIVVLSTMDAGAEYKYFGDANAPSAYERLELRVPPGWGKEAVPIRADRLDLRTEGDRIEVVGKDLPPLPREELRPPARTLLPLVWVRWWSPDGARGFRDWNAVARWNDALTAPVLDDRGAVDGLAASWKPAGASSFLASIAQAFDYAARSVRYVGLEEGIGGWKPHTPAFVVEHKYGDCKDKAFLLRAILGDWGYEGYPVDVRTSDRGPLAPKVPTYGQADHVILAVPLPEGVGGDLWSATRVEGLGRVLFLDATNSTSDPWTLRDDVQGTEAVIYKGGEAFLVTIPASPPSAARQDHALTATIDDQASLSGASLEESWSGLSANRLRSRFAEEAEEDRRQKWREYVQRRFPGSSLGDVRLEGIDRPGTDVRSTVALDAGRLGKRVEDLLIVEPGRWFYPVVETLPAPPRRYRLELGHAAEDHVKVAVKIPAGWVPEGLTPTVEVGNGDFEAHASWSFAGGILTYERTETLRTPSIPPERYADLRTALMKITGADQAGVVFVRAGSGPVSAHSSN